ncbi:MAG: hypothetical protein LIO75_07225 [Lachnospiraceae bacterium]|nr:hypothetical protein [Lachnospiraceae bacterium]
MSYRIQVQPLVNENNNENPAIPNAQQVPLNGDALDGGEMQDAFAQGGAHNQEGANGGNAAQPGAHNPEMQNGGNAAQPEINNQGGQNGGNAAQPEINNQGGQNGGNAAQPEVNNQGVPNGGNAAPLNGNGQDAFQQDLGELLVAVEQGNGAGPQEEQDETDDFFDRPDSIPEIAPLNSNIARLQYLKTRVDERRRSDVYRAVCAARWLNNHHRNPAARSASFREKLDMGGDAVLKGMEALGDVNNILSGADTIYGNFFSENSKTKNIIALVTNSIALVNSGINIIRKSIKIIDNAADGRMLTLDNLMLIVGAVGDGCLAASKISNIVKSAASLSGITSGWLKKLSAASSFMAGTSQLISLSSTSISMLRRRNSIRQFENDANLPAARSEAIRLINRYRPPGEAELPDRDVSQGGQTDLAIAARAKELLK